MNGINNNTDESAECPLCMEPLEVDDLNFFPCTCGYQICRFCWHRIRTDENELCPACRKAYPENPADFTPLTQEQIIAFKSQKKQRDQQRKQKITENRKHLANVRVVQRNLVFVVGLPPRLADSDVLKRHEYFGKFGKIHKVVINPSTTYAGVQGPSASAYVTYVHNCDALRAIQSVNNIMIDGRVIKTSLGTTKYCSHFMKNQQCPKSDCMYLHELGDPEASFTKEEMHQGKHQEYEKKLHDSLIANSSNSVLNSTTGTTILIERNTDQAKINKTSASKSAVTVGFNANVIKGTTQNKDAWPCLGNSSTENQEPPYKNKKDKKLEKVKSEKSKLKNNKCSNSNFTNNPRENQSQATTKDVFSKLEGKTDKKESIFTEKYSLPVNNETDKKQQKPRSKSITTNEEKMKVIKSTDTTNSSKSKNYTEKTSSEGDEFEKKRSISTDSNSSTNFDSISVISDSGSGKSSPGEYLDNKDEKTESKNKSLTDDNNDSDVNETEITSSEQYINAEKNCRVGDEVFSSDINETKITPHNGFIQLTNDTLAPLNLFDRDHLFSAGNNAQQSLSNVNRSSVGNAHLPDLLNGIDGNQYNLNTNEWNEALKNVFISHNTKNSDTIQSRHQDDTLQLEDIQRRNNFFNSMEAQQRALMQQQLLQQQQTFSVDKELFGTNMSRFFDFHKNQQQVNQHKCNVQQTPDRPPNEQKCYSGQFPHNVPTDDDLGFDPFIETQKALAELIENETVQQNSVTTLNNSNNSSSFAAKIMHHQQHQHQQLLDTMQHQRTRMPPPGFNHMNAFGLGVPRPQNTNKILPCMSGIVLGGNSNHNQQQIPPSNTWNSMHMSTTSMQPSNEAVGHQFIRNHKTEAYNGNDWTAMDPAILSLRQFPTYSTQNSMHHTHQPPSYMQQLKHSQNGHGFNSQVQTNNSMNITGGPIGSQHVAQAPVNANVQGMLEYLKTRQYV